MTKRLSKGEKRDRKRMATVASVYSVSPHPRTPSIIAKGCYPYNEKDKRPKPIGKRVWASVEKSVETVVDEMFSEAISQDPEKKKQWVILVDGNKTQIRMLKRKAQQMNIKVTIILDIIHVLEYLWKASYVFYPEGSEESQKWVNEKLYRILQGSSSLMVSSMKRQATNKNLSNRERKSVDDCARYLLNYKKHLRYHYYLSRGYPIATSVIEGACRYLVKDRMDKTGARWSLKGAEAVLKLRSLKSSGDFESYWKFHNYNGIRKILTPSLLDKKEKKYNYDLQKVA